MLFNIRSAFSSLELLENKVLEVSAKEFEAANKAGFQEILAEIRDSKKGSEAPKTVTAPPKEVVTYEIHGIEVIDLEDAASSLWEKGMYAETGMGCTGPVILVSDANADAARKILEEKGYIQ